MTAGGFEKIIPMVVGIMVFAGSLAVLVSLVVPSVTPDTDLLPPGESFLPLFSGSYWIPTAGNHVNSSLNMTYDYWETGWGFQEWPDESHKSWFRDPAAPNHIIDARIIYNNNRYDPDSPDPRYNLENYIALDGYCYNWLTAIYTDVWYRTISMDRIVENLDDTGNFSTTWLDCYDLSLVISAPAPGNHTTFPIYLANCDFHMYIAQSVNASSMDFVGVVVSIITFDTGWMSSNPFIAIMVSLIVDISLLLAGIRLFQGFIP